MLKFLVRMVLNMITPDNFYVDLNNPELIQTIRELKDEIQIVKQDNQIILEPNEYLLNKMNKQEEDE